MPRYFFHVKRGPVTILDQKGVELGNTADAVKEAARRAEKIVTEAAFEWNACHAGSNYCD